MGRFLAKEPLSFNILKSVNDKPPVFRVYNFKVGEYGIVGSQIGEASSSQVDFNASRVVPTAEDNRPYNIKLLPILIY